MRSIIFDLLCTAGGRWTDSIASAGSAAKSCLSAKLCRVLESRGKCEDFQYNTSTTHVPGSPNGSPKIGHYNIESIVVRYNLVSFLACLCYMDVLFDKLRVVSTIHHIQTHPTCQRIGVTVKSPGATAACDKFRMDNRFQTVGEKNHVANTNKGWSSITYDKPT